MGSKEIEDMGLGRAGDRVRGNPRTFTILDVDIPRADLLALYEGKPTEQALIRAVKQERRALSIASGGAEFLAFVESCRGGIGEDAQFYRLRPDCNGKPWLVIVKGNNRCAALRIVNDDRARAGQAPFDLTAVQAARPGTGDAAGEYAEEQHALSNVRARMLPSHSAEQAAKFAARGMAPEGIRRYIDGNPSVEEIEALIVLDGLCDEIKDACDAGRVKAVQCAVLGGKSEEAQRAWLARKTAPKPVRAAAVKRPTAKRVEAFAAHLSASPAFLQVLGLARGTLALSEVTEPDVRAAWLASEGVGAKGGK